MGKCVRVCHSLSFSQREAEGVYVWGLLRLQMTAEHRKSLPLQHCSCTCDAREAIYCVFIKRKRFTGFEVKKEKK